MGAYVVWQRSRARVETRGPWIPRARAPTVETMRGERGQAAAEMLGMLLAVSVIVAAVSTTEVGAKITRESRRIVCRIGGGDCTAQAAPGPLGRGADVRGPAIGAGQPITVLPFPASVGVGCS